MNAARIRELNDAFRSTFSGGKVVMTTSVYELPDCVRANVLVKVATFNEFTRDDTRSTISASSTLSVGHSTGRSTTTTNDANTVR